MMISSLRAVLVPLAFACISALPSTGQATLSRSGGVLGSNLTYTLQGDPGEVYYLIPAPTPGPTPIAIIDPRDNRYLFVGLQFLNLASLGFLDGSGSGSVVYPLPNDTSLSGIPIFAQYVTLPGVGTLIDDISTQTAFVLAAVGDSHFALSEEVWARQGQSTTVLDNGDVLIAGGDEPSTPTKPKLTLANVTLFKSRTQSFADSGNVMSVGRSTHTATKLSDGRVLFLGGYDASDTVIASGEIFDPATGTSTSIAPMSMARTQHSATLLGDGRVFVAGGSSFFDLSDPLGSFAQATAATEVYDPASNSWSPGPNLDKPTVGHADSMLQSGQAFLSGGVEISVIFGIPIPALLTKVYRYDGGSNAFLTTPDLPGRRVFHDQVTLADGRVFLAGGADGDFIALNFFPLATTAVYNPASNSWTSVAPLTRPRVYLNLLDLGNGILAADGLSSIDISTGSGIPEQVFEFSGYGFTSWTTAGTTIFPREICQSVAIDGGQRVLTSGAADDGVTTINKTAEVLIP